MLTTFTACLSSPQMAAFCLEQYKKRHVMHMGYEVLEVIETPEDRRTAAKTEVTFKCNTGKGHEGVHAWDRTAPGAQEAAQAADDTAKHGPPGSAEFGPPRNAGVHRLQLG